MKKMRIALMLSIFVLVSTLFWPQLLNKFFLCIAIVITLILLYTPHLRLFAIIPITAIYFSVYTSLTLTGQLFTDTKIVNKSSLVKLVDGKDHTIIVEIISLISESNHGYFNVKLIEVDTDHLNYSPLIEMRWYRPNIKLQAGQLQRFRARFKPVYGRANPGAFDRQKWSYSEHIAYQATIKKHLEVLDEHITYRAQFYEKVKSITNNLTNQGLLLALSFADKSLIPYAIKTQIRNLGISHLFAISGLHIGLLFSVVYLLAKFFYNRVLPASKLSWFSIRLINFSALMGAWGYAYLAGFSLPTQRAFLMLLVSVIILSLKRKSAQSDLLLLVLFFVLVWDPLAILSVSLWLSFIAVAIILLLLWIFPRTEVDNTKNYHKSNNGLTLKNKLIKYVSLLFILQVGLTLLMLPIQLEIFSGISLVAIVINFFAVPLFSLLIIPLVLLATGFSLIYDPLALMFFSFCDAMISFFFYFSDFVSTGYQHFSHLNKNLLIIIFVLILMLCLNHFHNQALRKIGYVFAVLIVILISQQKSKYANTWFVETIDVGQGLSVVVRNEDNILLYDTGARYPSGFNMVDNEIAPYLLYLGVNHIDHLVISHSDNDHAGGADIISNHVNVVERWAGEPLNSVYHFKQCTQGQHWQLGILKVEVLSPSKLGRNDNNNSCVLRISDGNTSVLLTGDIEKQQELILTKKLSDKLDSDILFAPHHGSRHSSSNFFIKSVSPKWVIYSAGFMNHWGFPANEVLDRYQKQSVIGFNSGLSGFIRFQISGQHINIKTFREDLAPYWYHRSFGA